jgi:folate-binding protein YgfZ
MGRHHNQGMTTPTLQGAVRLQDLGVVRALGSDAATFLHGQLTNDILSLDSRQARLAGYCSAKGRLLASFVVWRRGIDELLLACSADLLAPALKKLSMYVLRARCKLSDASADVALHGLAGDVASAWLGNAAPRAAWQRTDVGRAQVMRLPDAEGVARYLWAAPADEAPPALPALDMAAWHWLEVRSGVPRIVAATLEQFVPQMVNLELVGGVNFQKGCYPGQEIVARSQYRGTVKRRAFLYDAADSLQPGQEVYAGDDPAQPSGMVVNAASLDGGRHAALVEVKIAAADGALHAGSAQGPLLQRAALPYPIPAEAA